jgi:hypothetical protein
MLGCEARKQVYVVLIQDYEVPHRALKAQEQEYRVLDRLLARGSMVSLDLVLLGKLRVL